MHRVVDSLGWLAPALAAVAMLPAQQRATVVPAVHSTTEASGVALSIGSVDVRQQVMIGASHLATEVGNDIVALVFRHEGDTATTAGRLWVEVVLSCTGVDPWRASSEFARNHGGSPARVFEGWVDFPAAGAVSPGPAPWTAPHTVTIRLSTPFRYTGATLCVETVTRARDPQNQPTPAVPYWPIDAVNLPASGSVRRYGSACVPGFAPASAGAGERSLTLGGEAYFYILGRHNHLPVFLVVGSTPVDIGLAASGAPGCALYVDGWFLVANAMVTPRRGSFGLAPFALPLPHDAQLAGLALYAQWIAVTPSANQLGLTTSNGIEGRLALPRDPSHAWIESEDPAASKGVVGFDRLPVLRFELIKG